MKLDIFCALEDYIKSIEYFDMQDVRINDPLMISICHPVFVCHVGILNNFEISVKYDQIIYIKQRSGTIPPTKYSHG